MFALFFLCKHKKQNTKKTHKVRDEWKIGSNIVILRLKLNAMNKKQMFGTITKIVKKHSLGADLLKVWLTFFLFLDCMYLLIKFTKYFDFYFLFFVSFFFKFAKD